MPPKEAYYAVAVGTTPGIYSTWDACSKNVSGIPGARYKKFDTHNEAVTFIRTHSSQSSQPIVTHPPSPGSSQASQKHQPPPPQYFESPAQPQKHQPSLPPYFAVPLPPAFRYDGYSQEFPSSQKTTTSTASSFAKQPIFSSTSSISSSFSSSTSSISSSFSSSTSSNSSSSSSSTGLYQRSRDRNYSNSHYTETIPIAPVTQPHSQSTPQRYTATRSVQSISQPIPKKISQPIHELENLTHYQQTIDLLRATQDTIIIHLDGSASPNPGPCGSGIVIEIPQPHILKDDKIRDTFYRFKFYVSYGYGTSNYGELMAIRHAYDLVPHLLDKIKASEEFQKIVASKNLLPHPWRRIALISDSQWAIKTFLGQNKLTCDLYTKNLNVIPLIPRFANLHPIMISIGLPAFSVYWVKAHVGCAGNEIADKLAKLGTQESQDRFPEWKSAKSDYTDSFARDYVGTLSQL